RTFSGQGHAVTEIPVDRVEQDVSTHRVFAAGATQVAVVSAAAYKFGKRLLVQCGGVPVTEPLGGGESRHQRLGYHQIPDAERRKNRARESAYIDDSPLGIEPLQGFHGLAFVAELPVVVVLDYHRVSALGPFE